jgi:hypothetical protein
MSLVKMFDYHPVGNMFLGNAYEYHINAYELDQSFTVAYQDNTGKDFFKTVENYLEETHNHNLSKVGFDTIYDDDGYGPYIWVHINQKERNDKILDTIIEDLNKKYIDEWSHYNVRKLTRIISSRMRYQPNFLAQSVSHHQKMHGYEATQNALHILFTDLI